MSFLRRVAERFYQSLRPGPPKTFLEKFIEEHAKHLGAGVTLELTDSQRVVLVHTPQGKRAVPVPTELLERDPAEGLHLLCRAIRAVLLANFA